MAPGFNRTEAEARDYYIKKQARKEIPMMKADGDRYDTQMIGENAGLVLCECHVYVPQEYKLVISEVQRVTMLMRRDGEHISSRIFMRPIPGLLSAKMKICHYCRPGQLRICQDASCDGKIQDRCRSDAPPEADSFRTLRWENV